MYTNPKGQAQLDQLIYAGIVERTDAPVRYEEDDSPVFKMKDYYLCKRDSFEGNPFTPVTTFNVSVLY